MDPFDSDPTLLPDHVRDLFWRDVEGKRLGSDGGGEFVVGDSGAVRWVAQPPDNNTRFVNSSVSLFAEFLRGMGALRDAARGLTEQQSVESFRDLRERLRARDAAALKDPDSWWSVVFEQIEDGLL